MYRLIQIIRNTLARRRDRVSRVCPRHVRARYLEMFNVRVRVVSAVSKFVMSECPCSPISGGQSLA